MLSSAVVGAIAKAEQRLQAAFQLTVLRDTKPQSMAAV